MAQRRKKQEPAVVRRDGGLCVTLANTASAKRESFSSYAELLAWGLRLGVVTGADVERLERAAAERPAAAEKVLRRALELRDGCRRTLRGLIEGRAPSDADVELLRAELELARSAERWVRDGIGCRWVVGDRGGDDLDRVLWPLVRSMEEVLGSKYRFKVGRCAGEGCDLLFVDRTAGSARKWCDKNACGRKDSTRRYYQKRVKPVRERIRQMGAKRRKEARERDSEKPPADPAGRRPGPRVA